MTTTSRPPPDLASDVREFHRKFGLAYDGPPRTLPDAIRDFRAGFLEEELDEYTRHLDEAESAIRRARLAGADRGEIAAALAEQLDALVDLVYVAVGCADLQGFDFSEAWRRVHAANMAKVRASSAGDSARGSSFDVVKPPGWRAPDHTDLVADHAHKEAL